MPGRTYHRGPPKTTAGRRAVSIPQSLADLLEQQLQRPEVICSGLVFPTPLGEPARRSNFGNRVWMPATRAVGLTGLRFHDLRHTAVALAIAQGAPPKAIQERMGHSSVVVTLDRYGHLFEGLDTDIADGLDDVLRISRGLPAVSATPAAPSRLRGSWHERQGTRTDGESGANEPASKSRSSCTSSTAPSWASWPTTANRGTRTPVAIRIR